MNYFGLNWWAADPFSDNCPYYFPVFDCRTPNYKFNFIEEEFGEDSLCYSGTAIKSGTIK